MSDSNKDRDGQERPQRSGGSSGQRGSGSTAGRKPYGDRDAKRPYGSSGDRKPYGDRDKKRSYGDRDATRSHGGSGDRKPYGDRDAKRPYGGRDERKPYGDRDQKRPYGGHDDRKPYGDRDQKRSYGDRDATRSHGSSGDRKPYGDRDQRRSYGDRDAKRPYGARDDRKPYADRDQKRSYGDRDATRSHGGSGDRKPYGDRDAKRPYGGRDDRKPYGDRDQRRSYGDRDQKRPYGGRDDRKPYGDRDQKRPYGTPGSGHAGGRHDGDRRGAPTEASHERHGAADLPVRPRHDDPFLPAEIEARQLDKVARAELKTLSKENADWVARHLVAASEYLDDDPELAHQHAMSAARRAGRIAVVRETLAITAYATGDFSLALRELRTYRRISGNNDQLPLMVDSERGVGRPDRALEVGRAVDRNELPVAVQVGLAIAMSGARLDLGQPELALAELEIPQLDPDRAFSYSPALFSAYAEVLEELGRDGDASRWRVLAARAEAALAGPAEAELIEIFELESDEPADAEIDDQAFEADVEIGNEEHVVDGDAAIDELVASSEDTASGDPGDVLEDDVRAVLAEGDALDGEDATEDSADGAVPSED
ncbi:primosomal protein [Agromyces sp. NPDC127015]|uniref:primosomal protein n=1 Tax=Agromyces sp. NPDC127015 TaxID=3347108 RepID=UPI003668462D